MLRITTSLFSCPSLPLPQNLFGIRLDITARQNADTSERGVAKETKGGLGGSARTSGVAISRLEHDDGPDS